MDRNEVYLKFHNGFPERECAPGDFASNFPCSAERGEGGGDGWPAADVYMHIYICGKHQPTTFDPNTPGRPTRIYYIVWFLILKVEEILKNRNPNIEK